MKLGTVNDGSRDGQLVVVSRDIKRAVKVPEIAQTLQQAIENWSSVESDLEGVYRALNEGGVEGAFQVEPDAMAAPLPRAYQWADGSAYLNHVKLVRMARGAEVPESFWQDPLMYQGGSDKFTGATQNIVAGSEEWGIDFEGEIAVITDDVPMGVSSEEAAGHIKLLMLVNDVSLRNLIPGELAKGFGFFQSKPASSFSLVAVTPDELGSSWKDGRVHLPLTVHLNGKEFGRPDSGPDMVFSFPDLVAHAAKTRELGAGSIVGSGTVSNPDKDGGPGKPIDDGGVGYSCLAEVRMVETILRGKPETSFMKFGDRVRMEMFGEDGQSIFGAIEQTVVSAR